MRLFEFMEGHVCSLKPTSRSAKKMARVNVVFFTLSRDDDVNNDGMVAKGNSKEELASHVHLTQVHDLIIRVSGQLDRVRGEQRYFRAR
jgi:hypothetical protein